MSTSVEHPADMAVKPLREHDWVVNAAPTRRWPALRIREIWMRRELIYFFTSRDLKVRYKQAFLGVAWAGIQPVVGAITFTILFNRLADIDVEGRSYFAFALLGYGVWTYFSSSMQSGTSSLLSNADLLTKVSFPRIVAPLATFVPGLIDLTFAVVTAFVISVAAGDGVSPLACIVGLPVGLALLVLAVAGPAVFLSATVVKYRDAATIAGFGLQLLLFASPVAYPPSVVPAAWRWVMYLNPLSGALGLLRWALTHAEAPSAPQLAISWGMAFVLAGCGLVHFRRSEREFADII